METNNKSVRPLLKIKMLGDFSVTFENKMISGSSLRAKKMWVLFKYLLTNNRKAISVDTLVNILWDDDSECENPTKALYSLVHRLRNVLETAAPKNSDFILFRRGSYVCNPYPYCCVDAFEFETLAKKAEREDISPEEKIHYLLRAISLYKGDFLLESSCEQWVIPISAYYKRLYISIVEKLCEIYTEFGRYEDIIMLCEKAISINNMEEVFHVLLIRALMSLGRFASANAQYEYISKLLLGKLGAKPSIELQNINKELHNLSNSIKSTLSDINNALKEREKITNAFFCDFDTFRQIYNMKLRVMPKGGRSGYIGVITIICEDNKYSSQSLAEGAQALKRASMEYLGNCDVISQYSATQFVYMLQNTALKDGAEIEKLIRKSFDDKQGKNEFKLDFEISKIEP